MTELMVWIILEALMIFGAIFYEVIACKTNERECSWLSGVLTGFAILTFFWRFL